MSKELDKFKNSLPSHPELPPPKPFERTKKVFTPVLQGISIQLMPKVTSEGGIILPDMTVSREKTSAMCLVIAVGPDVRHVKEGDVVVLGSAPSWAVGLPKQQDLWVVGEPQIAGVIAPEFYEELGVPACLWK